MLATAMLFAILGTSFVEANTLHVQNTTDTPVWVHLKARHKNKRKRTRHNEGTFKLEKSGTTDDRHAWNYSSKRVRAGESLQNMDVYNYDPSQPIPTEDGIKTKINQRSLRIAAKDNFITIVNTSNHYKIMPENNYLSQDQLTEKRQTSWSGYYSFLKRPPLGEIKIPRFPKIAPEEKFSKINLSYYSDAAASPTNKISDINIGINGVATIPTGAKSLKVLNVG